MVSSTLLNKKTSNIELHLKCNNCNSKLKGNLYTLGKMRAEMHSTFWKFFNKKSARLNCLISVGYHLELRVARSVCWDFCTK